MVVEAIWAFVCRVTALVLSWWILAVALSCGVIFFFYLIWYVRTPRLHFVDSERNRRFVSGLPQLRRRFWPTFYLAHQMLQSAVANFYRRAPNLRYDRELVEMRDGEIVAVDWYRPDQITLNHTTPSHATAHAPTPSAGATTSAAATAGAASIASDDLHATTPTVLVLHGLAGNSHEPNVQILVKLLRETAGLRVCVWNRRGCAKDLKMRHAKPYMYGDTRDMTDVVSHLTRRYPASPLIGIGLSAGSNPLVKYLGEQGDRSKIIAGMSVCNAFDLDKCARLLTTRPFYDHLMAKSLRVTLFEQHIDTFGGLSHIDLNRIRKVRSVRDFDHLFTCQLYGYDDVSNYHAENSSVTYLAGVRVPLLCLNSLDDPIVHSSLIPYSHALANPYVVIATTHGGGHLGWVSGLFPFTGGPSWMERLCVQFCSAVRNEHAVQSTMTPAQKFLDSLSISKATAAMTHGVGAPSTPPFAAMRSPKHNHATPPFGSLSAAVAAVNLTLPPFAAAAGFGARKSPAAAPNVLSVPSPFAIPPSIRTPSFLQAIPGFPSALSALTGPTEDAYVPTIKHSASAPELLQRASLAAAASYASRLSSLDGSSSGGGSGSGVYESRAGYGSMSRPAGTRPNAGGSGWISYSGTPPVTSLRAPPPPPRMSIAPAATAHPASPVRTAALTATPTPAAAGVINRNGYSFGLSAPPPTYSAMSVFGAASTTSTATVTASYSSHDNGYGASSSNGVHPSSYLSRPVGGGGGVPIGPPRSPRSLKEVSVAAFNASASRNALASFATPNGASRTLSGSGRAAAAAAAAMEVEPPTAANGAGADVDPDEEEASFLASLSVFAPSRNGTPNHASAKLAHTDSTLQLLLAHTPTHNTAAAAAVAPPLLTAASTSIPTLVVTALPQPHGSADINSATAPGADIKSDLLLASPVRTKRKRVSRAVNPPTAELAAASDTPRRRSSRASAAPPSQPPPAAAAASAPIAAAAVKSTTSNTATTPARRSSRAKSTTADSSVDSTAANVSTQPETTTAVAASALTRRRSKRLKP